MAVPTFNADPNPGTSIATRIVGRLDRVAVGLFWVFIFLVPVAPINGYHVGVIQQVLIYSILTLGLNLLSGYAQQISVGHVALFATGAYVSTLLVVQHGWPWFAAAVVAIAASVMLGVVIGLPSLRLDHFYFAMVTLAVAGLVPQVLIDWDSLTGGYIGIGGIPRPNAFGITLSPDALFWFTALCALGAYLLGTAVGRSSLGRALYSLRETRPAARSSGISVTATLVWALVFSGALAGLAGVLFAGMRGYIAPDDFTVFVSITFFISVVIGGGGTNFGPIVGSAVIVVLPQVMRNQPSIRLMVYGALLIIIAGLWPSGVVGSLRRWRRRWLERAASRGSGTAEAQGRDFDLSGIAEVMSAGAGVPSEALSIRGLTKDYGGVRACDHINLDVQPGEIVGLIGANGSGKSTLLNLVSALTPADDGRVEIAGEDVTSLPAHLRSRRGLGRTFQTPQLMEGLTALDNVLLGQTSHPEGGGAFRDRKQRAKTEGRAALASVGLEAQASVQVEDLNHVERRLVEIARVLVGRPSLLLLDEPCAGLSQTELQSLSRLLRVLAEAGLGVLLIEHNVHFVASLCDRIYVLHTGELLASGPTEEVLADDRVIGSYLGSAVML